MRDVVCVGNWKLWIIFFFKCHIARSIWFCFKEALGWDKIPSSVSDVMENWIPLGIRNYHIKLFTLIVVLWGIWSVRNKMAIEKKFPKSSNEVLVKIFKFMLKWRALLKGQDVQFLDEKLETVKKWLEDFWSRTNDMEVEGVLWSNGDWRSRCSSCSCFLFAGLHFLAFCFASLSSARLCLYLLSLKVVMTLLGFYKSWVFLCKKKIQIKKQYFEIKV